MGGFSHVTIGVPDMERSLGFFNCIIGYDVVIIDTDESPAELEPVTGGQPCHWIALKQSRKPQDPLPLEAGMVTLVEARGYKGKSIIVNSGILLARPLKPGSVNRAKSPV